MDKLGLAIVLGLAVCACDKRPPSMTLADECSGLEDARFKVSLVGEFKDGLAYSGKRGVYVLKDTKSGREYVGVSGIGISELGEHTEQKKTVRDER